MNQKQQLLERIDHVLSRLAILAHDREPQHQSNTLFHNLVKAVNDSFDRIKNMDLDTMTDQHLMFIEHSIQKIEEVIGEFEQQQ